MGKLLSGSTQHAGNVSLLTDEQQQLFSQLLTGLGPQLQGTLGGLLQPGEQDYQDVFQKSYVDPAMQALNQQIIPGIQQQFADTGSSASSALNQALAQSASDVSTAIGSQYGQFLQGQQAMQQQGQLGGIQGLLSLLTNQTFTPMIHQTPSLLATAVGGAGKYFGLN